jgi:hypothetical protein
VEEPYAEEIKRAELVKEIISLTILRFFGAEAAPKIRVGKRNYEKVAPVDSQFLFPSSH